MQKHDAAVVKEMPASLLVAVTRHIGDSSCKNKFQLSHEKNPPTFHYTGWLIGTLIMDYNNPYITG